MIDISKSFSQTSEPLSNFFQQPGVGYYIPLYQREYSWDPENIEQLMEDIFTGVKSLVQDGKDSGDQLIHFMGTVILFQESNPKQNIQPRDDRALPSRIDNVIDGQQRISTIALLACILLKHLMKLRKILPKDSTFDALRTEIDSKKDLLLELFSVDIKRGKPTRKPIIIRGSIDGWTFDGQDDANYKSGVSAYLSKCIRIDSDGWINQLKTPSDQRVARNIQEIEKWLKKVEEVGFNDENDFPRAKEILKKVPEEFIWTYPRPDIVSLIEKTSDTMDPKERTLESLTQLLIFIHYLAERCCFTVIKPVSEEWAFDMFQSLNASGTPLTAIETFKPLVVNYLSQDGGYFKGTKSEEYFKKVDSLIGDTGPSAKKNKLTDEFLTAFALTYDGFSLSTQFSKQRRWLNDTFKSCKLPVEREEFIHRMGDLATYWENVVGFEPNNDLAIEGLESLTIDEKEISGLCVLYLRESGHKMANTILSRFYSQVLRREKQEAAKEFVQACKAVAAFYTLWRAAQSNSGLDDVYRKLFKSGDNTNNVRKMSWVSGNDALDISKLKTYLRGSLGTLGEESQWMSKASQNLRFDQAKPVCKFALFVSAHDTIPDKDELGLMKVAQPGVRPFLKPSNWISSDFKTIEHIAPQKGDLENWDKDLYENDRFQAIGNLTLLPVDINSSIGNQPWNVKVIYYRHLAESDPSKVVTLQEEAKTRGVELQSHTIDLLKNASYKHHMESIIGISSDESWTLSLVEKRTTRICSIVWERLWPWLS